MPIQDFRTLREGVARPSADLLDTIYAMQRRQDWLREERRDGEGEPLDFVGSARIEDEPEAVGREMRRVVGLDDGWAAEVKTWTEAVGELRRRTEKLGVIAVINGVVGNNTSRRLDVHEFRGFALTDSYAPLIFVCDRAAAEFLVPADELKRQWPAVKNDGDTFERLARHFKVSPIVAGPTWV